LPFAFGSEFVCFGRSETSFPFAYRLVGKLEAALQEYLGQIAQAEFVAHTPEDHPQDDIGGICKVVEGRASPLVEDPATCPALKGPIPSGVFLLCSVVVVAAQWGQDIGGFSLTYLACHKQARGSSPPPYTMG